ncbi:MAG TPA: hypothetical protein VGR14_13010 [Verrucomicrobiae bacterium]|jgi:hypothetical protein|nr:hypothetical protein [Verrucomicrobiae bacterium]
MAEPAQASSPSDPTKRRWIATVNGKAVRVSRNPLNPEPEFVERHEADSFATTLDAGRGTTALRARGLDVKLEKLSIEETAKLHPRQETPYRLHGEGLASVRPAIPMDRPRPAAKPARRMAHARS